MTYPGFDVQPTFSLRITHKFRQRRTEWVAGVQCMLWGLILLMPMETFASPAFRVFQQIMPEFWWGVILLAIGTVRIIGLIVNGARRRVTPWLRLVSALLGFGVFTGISLCFASAGLISTWIAAWPVLMVVELMNIHDTARDARQANG
jgi:hypothetical protein